MPEEFLPIPKSTRMFNLGSKIGGDGLVYIKADSCKYIPEKPPGDLGFESPIGSHILG